MAEDADARVRIEIDTDTSIGALAVEAPDSSRSLRVRVAGLAALVIVGGLLATAMQGDDREGRDDLLDGLPVEPRSSFVPQSSARQLAPAAVEATEDEAPSVSRLEPTNLLGNIAAIVSADRGWLAMHWSGDSQLPPRLERSLDGLDWQLIETTFDLPEMEDGRRQFSHFRPSADGYSMLMTSTTAIESGSNDGVARIDRLVSQLGAKWRVDPNFVPIEGSGQPFAEADGWVLTGVWGQVDDHYGALLGAIGQELREPALIEEACLVYGGSSTRIDFMSCTQGEGVIVRADDLVDPERFDEIRGCVDALSPWPSFDGVLFTATADSGRPRALDDLVSVVVGPSLLDDGTIVVVDAGTGRFEQDPCVEIAPEMRPRGAEVVVWPPDAETPHRIPIAHPELDSTPLFGGVRSIAQGADGLLIAIGDDVLRVDDRFVEVETLLQMPNRGFVNADTLTPDGTRVVSVAGGQVTLTEVVSGDTSVLADRGTDPGWVWPIAVTNEVAFFATESRISMVDLTPP